MNLICKNSIIKRVDIFNIPYKGVLLKIPIQLLILVIIKKILHLFLSNLEKSSRSAEAFKASLFPIQKPLKRNNPSE